MIVDGGHAGGAVTRAGEALQSPDCRAFSPTSAAATHNRKNRSGDAIDLISS